MFYLRLSVTLKTWKWAIGELEAICCTSADGGSVYFQRRRGGDREAETDRGESYLNLLSIQSDSTRLVSAPYCSALWDFVLVKPSWATFRNGGPSWREWALTAVAIKWKQIWGLLYGLWNSTALWSQISCPLHLSIWDHWFLRRFNLLSGVWLVMIYRALCSPSKTWKQSFWWIIYFLSVPFHVWTLKIHRLWPHPPERSAQCPLVISGNWRSLFSPHHSKSSSRGHQLKRHSHEKMGWQVSAAPTKLLHWL